MQDIHTLNRWRSPSLLDTEPGDAVDDYALAVEQLLEAADLVSHMLGNKRTIHLLFQCADALR